FANSAAARVKSPASYAAAPRSYASPAASSSASATRDVSTQRVARRSALDARSIIVDDTLLWRFVGMHAFRRLLVIVVSTASVGSAVAACFYDWPLPPDTPADAETDTQGPVTPADASDAGSDAADGGRRCSTEMPFGPLERVPWAPSLTL